MVRGGLSLIPHLCTGLALSVAFVLVSVIFSSVRCKRVDLGKVSFSFFKLVLTFKNVYLLFN